MPPDTLATRMIDALDGASSLQLYQLRALIDGLLADPKRTMAAGAALHLGQAVRFVDFRTGELRQGKVVAKQATQASVLEDAKRRTWKLPVVAIEAAETTPGEAAKPYDPPPEPARPASPTGFAVGDRVTFEGRSGSPLIGVVSRINRQTATVVTDNRESWRVAFGLLRHVVEV